MKRWIVGISVSLVCAGLVAVLAMGFGRDPRAVPFMLQGKPAPEFSLKRIDNGEHLRLSELKGKPVVINFWASWCGPCKMEHRVLEWGGQRFRDQVAFVGVVFEDTEENARAFLEQHGMSFPQLLDQHSGTAVDYGCAGVPETYFVDAEGIIRHKHIGPISPRILDEQVRKLFEPAAAQAARQD